MVKFSSSFILSLCFLVSFSQSSKTKIEMIASNWNTTKEATFEKFDNRETLVLKKGRITVKNQKFTNGTIEVDVYANTIRSFAGITFRKKDNTMEEVYMRLHKTNQADAIQYTPIFNNESNWQLYREHQANVLFKNKGWNTLRIEVNNDQAKVFVNNEEVMSISNLRTDNISGEIGLFALFTNRFSNFRITPKESSEVPEKTEETPTDLNIIKKWKITEAKLFDRKNLNFKNFLKEEYITVTTEKSGLLPISKYIKKASSGNFEQNTEDYTIAFTNIYSEKEETKLFSFDYSDTILVYLNGKIIFEGKNGFRTKGIQYMGHLDINTNTLYMPLKKGNNTIHCVVIDKANGWGLMAKMQ
ncbi:DUF1080 domain-containing protein [Aquimarina sp. AD1]|nr:DUF1080 domain-containing protein [Aquimarina sp. AD1]RKN10335.1 DUF1080 domain-containing protein [Aquimarina sp. AD1]